MFDFRDSFCLRASYPKFKFIFNKNYTQNSFCILIPNEKCLHQRKKERKKVYLCIEEGWR